MLKKVYQEKLREIKSKINMLENDIAYHYLDELIYSLHEDENFKYVCEIYFNPLFEKNQLIRFEIAYALDQLNHKTDAEWVYEKFLEINPESVGSLNNLSNIKKDAGDFYAAWELIQIAKRIDTDNEVINRNYENLQEKIIEIERVDSEFKYACEKISKENNFVIDKLTKFINNSKMDTSFEKGEIPIPSWKFKILMETDEQKANSLKDQWITKNYIYKTGKRGKYNEHIYQLNPYIEKQILSIIKNELPENWIVGIENMEIDKLESLGYFDITNRLNKIQKKYRYILQRDVNELFLNYIMKNKKATITLSGSIVETVLIYYCEKKKIKKISYTRNNNQRSKKLYDSDLGDLLSYFEEQGILSNTFVHMGNISRISRNFIHPGKELNDSGNLDEAKVNICFISSIEIIKAIC